MMKMRCVCLALGLVLLIAVSDATPHGLIHPYPCCFTFITFKIPPSEIKEIIKLHSSCPKEGYVAVTPKGRLCVREKDAPTLLSYNPA
ncbi:C-C motif chemokine 14-like [Hoplias malabaricus]|uniref:C-C motif chemokine 14-like n=1 Tax=Hoplias malabaricus TaxID=27720 RepID=UPI00346317D3